MAEYRKPWTDGAKAYPEVDTHNGIALSMYRKRTSFMVSVEVGTPLHNSESCSVCGKPLSEAAEGTNGRVEGARGMVYPKAKTYELHHYVCGWTNIMKQVVALSVKMR